MRTQSPFTRIGLVEERIKRMRKEMLMRLSKNLNQMLLNLPKRDFGRFETIPFQITEISGARTLRR